MEVKELLRCWQTIKYKPLLLEEKKKDYKPKPKPLLNPSLDSR